MNNLNLSKKSTNKRKKRKVKRNRNTKIIYLVKIIASVKMLPPQIVIKVHRLPSNVLKRLYMTIPKYNLKLDSISGKAALLNLSLKRMLRSAKP